MICSHRHYLTASVSCCLSVAAMTRHSSLCDLTANLNNNHRALPHTSHRDAPLCLDTPGESHTSSFACRNNVGTIGPTETGWSAACVFSSSQGRDVAAPSASSVLLPPFFGWRGRRGGLWMGRTVGHDIIIGSSCDAVAVFHHVGLSLTSSAALMRAVHQGRVGTAAPVCPNPSLHADISGPVWFPRVPWLPRRLLGPAGRWVPVRPCYYRR